MQRLICALILSAWPLAAQAAQADPVFPGGWSRALDGRPRLDWEGLRGYRLFFHPADPEGARRSLTLAVPAGRRLDASWAIVRPLTGEGPLAKAWLRVEGEPDLERGRVSLAWDGRYQARPFPDGPYRFEVHLRYAGGEPRRWDLLVLKSKDKPRLLSVAGRDVSAHRLAFRAGQYEPEQAEASLPRSLAVAPLIAGVHLPGLPDPFSLEGILVQGRRVADAEGRPVWEDWDCLCQQPLPQDSPARTSWRRVRCDWDLASAQPGTWDLRLGLYHRQRGLKDPEPCDQPLLDEDRVRVRLLP